MEIKAPLRRVMRDAMKLWYLLIASTLSTAAYMLLDMVSRSYMGQVVDAVLVLDSSFWFKFAMMVIPPFLAAPFHTTSMLSKFGMAYRLSERLRIAVGEKSIRVNLPVLEQQMSGDVMTHLGEQMNVVSRFVSNGLAEIATMLVGGVGTVLFMGWVDIPQTLLFTVLALAVLPISQRLSKPIKGYEKRRMDAFGKAQGVAGEGLHALKVVKSFRLEDVLTKKYWKSMQEALAAELRWLFVVLRMETIGGALGYLPMMVMLTVGAVRISHGTLSVGQLLSLTTLSSGLMGWFTIMPSLLNYFQQCRAAASRLYSFLDLPEEKGGPYDTPDENAPAVAFSNVEFAYSEEHPVLRGVSFSVKKGETVALVGESGGGKSTVLKLICGFLQPGAGEVLVAGGEISEWALAPLRRRLAYVTQDSYLFPGTIRENLLAARAGASQEELSRVCEQAGILDFVEERGWDAQVGERGVQLSGGERQRLSIARALLKDAPLLLLDEPTASLDAAAEHIVQQGLERLMQGRTTLVVAHRLATIRRADRILVLDKGTITAGGTHDELMKDCPIYRQLVRQQLMAAGK